MGILKISDIFATALGGLAQLARAFAWHAKGHRFDSVNLHSKKAAFSGSLFLFTRCYAKKRRKHGCLLRLNSFINSIPNLEFYLLISFFINKMISRYRQAIVRLDIQPEFKLLIPFPSEGFS